MEPNIEARAREALEISSGYLLDQIRFGRRLFDFLDALIVVAVTQANIEPVLRDPVLNRAYATYELAPPDELRRPISINALAQSLRLPFETTRRRVSRLTRLGMLRAGPEGIWTPGSQVQSPFHRHVAESGYARIQALYGRLAHLPELQVLHQGAPWSGSPPLRAAARTGAAYLLRLVDGLTEVLGDPIDAAVWLETLRSNAEGREPGSRVRYPVRVGAIAKRLGLPAETVRRRAANLISKALCEQTSRGLLVSEAVLSRPEILGLIHRNLADLRRMFESLAALGALGSETSDSALAAA